MRTNYNSTYKLTPLFCKSAHKLDLMASTIVLWGMLINSCPTSNMILV